MQQSNNHLELECLHCPDEAAASLDVLQEGQNGVGSCLPLLLFLLSLQGGLGQQLPMGFQGLPRLPGLHMTLPPFGNLGGCRLLHCLNLRTITVTYHTKLTVCATGLWDGRICMGLSGKLATAAVSVVSNTAESDKEGLVSGLTAKGAAGVLPVLFLCRFVMLAAACSRLPLLELRSMACSDCSVPE